MGRAHTKHLVTLQDLQSLEDTTYLQLSPRGDMLAYVRKEHLWLVGTREGSLPRQFGNAKLPLWSPDGKKLAYYSSESGTNQFWILDVDVGVAEQVTNLAGGIDPDLVTASYWFYDSLRYGWSPDATRLVFTSRVIATDANPEDPTAEEAIQGPSERTTAPLVLNTRTPPEWTLRGVLRRAGDSSSWTAGEQKGNSSSQRKYNQLFVVNIGRKVVEQLTRDNAGYFHPDWSPDGQKIVCASTEGHSSRGTAPAITNIYLIDVATGKRTALTGGAGEKRVPTWSLDGRWIAYLGREGFGSQSVFVIQLDGGEPIKATEKLARDVMDFHWFPDGVSIAVVSVDGVSWPISRVDIRTGKIELLSQEGAAHRWPVAVSRSGTLAWQQSDGSQKGVIFVRSSLSSFPYTLIDLNPQIKEWALGTQEVIRWKNNRGEDK